MCAHIAAQSLGAVVAQGLRSLIDTTPINNKYLDDVNLFVFILLKGKCKEAVVATRSCAFILLCTILELFLVLVAASDHMYHLHSQCMRYDGDGCLGYIFVPGEWRIGFSVQAQRAGVLLLCTLVVRVGCSLSSLISPS